MTQSIISAFEQNCARHPDKPFLTLELPREKGSVTYREMRNLAQRCGAGLIANNIAPGGIVLIFLPPGSLALGYFLGAMMAGFVPSFMPLPSPKQDPQHYWSSHIKLFDRIGPSALVTDDWHANEMKRHGIPSGATKLITRDVAETSDAFAMTPSNGEDVAFLQHSSGTTSLKKGVMLSHGAVLAQVAAYAARLSATSDDVVVSWLPVYHDMGLIACFITPLVLGQTIVLLDPFHWVTRPASLFHAVATHGGSFCWMPNFAFEHMANVVRPDPARMRLHTMKAFINCSEPCHATSFDKFLSRFEVLGVERRMLQTCYALAEAVFAVSQTEPGKSARVISVDQQALQERGEIAAPQSGVASATLLSSGKCLQGVSVSVRDADGRILPEGQVGELYITAPFLFSGYYGMPDLSSARLMNGTYRTSDRGVLVDEHLYVLGRLDDLLIINGRNFHASEIEAQMSEVEGTKPGRNVAFALFNDDTGCNELIVVCERAESELPDDDLRALVRSAIFSGFGFYPADVAVVEHGWLSKTTSGKISRGLNAERYISLRDSSAIGGV